MKRLWAWIKARLNGGPPPVPLPAGEGENGNGHGASPLPLSLALGTAERSGEGDDDSGRLTAAARRTQASAKSRAPETTTDNDNDNDNGGRLEAGAPRNDDGTLAERLEQLRVRLKEIEEAMAAGDMDGAGEAAEGGGEAEVLAKAHVAAGVGAHRACAPTVGGDGVDVTGEMTVVVSRGIPQGIPGQQARRKTARLWEGVL